MTRGCGPSVRRKHLVDDLNVDRVALRGLVAALRTDMLLQEVRQVRVVLWRRVFVLEQGSNLVVL